MNEWQRARPALPFVGLAALCLVLHAMSAQHLSITLSWHSLAMVRSLLTLPLLLGVFWSNEKIQWLQPALLARSIFGACFVCLFYLSLARIPTADVLAITSTSLVWLTLIYWVVSKSRPPLVYWGALLIMFVGVAILERVTPLHDDIGLLFAIMAAMSTAAGMFAIDHCYKVSARVIILHLMVVLFLVGFVGGLLDEFSDLEGLSELGTWQWIAFLGMAWFSLGFQFALVKAIKMGYSLSASFAVVLAVVISTIFGFLTDGLDLTRVLATILVLMPCIFILGGAIGFSRPDRMDIPHES